MDRDPATVEVTLYDCQQCEKSMTPTYHGGRHADAPILHIDGERRCSGCGVGITTPEADSCFDCGGRAPPVRFAVPLDFSPSVSPERVEQAVHEATNRHRAEHGKSTLAYSDHLSAIALQHSRDMAVNGYLDHQSPEGDSTGDRYRAHDHDDSSYGENISYRQPGPTISVTGLAESIVDGWMDSPGHRENILKDRHEAEGIGIYTTDEGLVYATQNFK